MDHFLLRLARLDVSVLVLLAFISFGFADGAACDLTSSGSDIDPTGLLTAPFDLGENLHPWTFLLYQM